MIIFHYKASILKHKVIAPKTLHPTFLGHDTFLMLDEFSRTHFWAIGTAQKEREGAACGWCLSYGCCTKGMQIGDWSIDGTRLHSIWRWRSQLSCWTPCSYSMFRFDLRHIQWLGHSIWRWRSQFSCWTPCSSSMFGFDLRHIQWLGHRFQPCPFLWHSLERRGEGGDWCVVVLVIWTMDIVDADEDICCPLTGTAGHPHIWPMGHTALVWLD